ncbi:MAG: hypothetical protein OEZ34_11390, partial [Spirochaetia bacterium]|nr:hypothetical protein [Spirochaetia bacterium]
YFHHIIKKENLSADNFQPSVSFVMFLMLLLMVFVGDFQPFRIYDQAMKAGGGLFRNYHEIYELTGFIFFDLGCAGFLMILILQSVRTEETSRNILLRIRILFAGSFLFLGLSFYFSLYSFQTSGIFMKEGQSLFFTFAVFLSALYLLSYEMGRKPSGSLSFFYLIFAAGTINSVSEAMSSETAGLIFSGAGLLLLLLNFILTLAMPVLKRPTGELFLSRFFPALILLLIVSADFFVSVTDLCSRRSVLFCTFSDSPETVLNSLRSLLYIVSIFFVFVLFFNSDLFGKIRGKGWKGIFLSAVPAAAFSAGPVFFLSQSFDGRNLFDLWIYLLLPFSALLIFFSILYLLIENSKKLREPGKMTVGYIYFFREMVLNYRLYIPGMFVISFLMFLVSGSGFFLEAKEHFTFHYYLAAPESEYSDTVHYKSEDKFFFEGYELSPYELIFYSDFNDSADPKKPEHLIMAREHHLRIYNPGSVRTAGKTGLSRPHLYEDEGLFFSEPFDLFPGGTFVALDQFFPAVEPSNSEIFKDPVTGVKFRKRIQRSGDNYGLIDGIKVTAGHLDLKADMNHLFEYYYYFTDRSRQFYAGVFPEKISLSFSAKTAPLFLYFFLSFFIFSAAACLYLLIFYNELREK